MGALLMKDLQPQINETPYISATSKILEPNPKLCTVLKVRPASAV